MERHAVYCFSAAFAALFPCNIVLAGSPTVSASGVESGHGNVPAEVLQPSELKDCVPLLAIGTLADPPYRTRTDWQVLWNGVPLSDAQVAQLAGNEPLMVATRDEVATRGSWVYTGLGIAAAGTAISSAGWTLWGQGNVPQGAALGMAVGGVLVGIAGLIVVTESVQIPVEPFVAPSMSHRLNRQEMAVLVRTINSRLLSGHCRIEKQ